MFKRIGQIIDYNKSFYDDTKGSASLCPVCDVTAVLKRIPIEELQELVNEPLRKTEQIVDFDRRRGSVTNEEIMEYLSYDYGLRHPTDLQLYSKECQCTKSFVSSSDYYPEMHS